MDLQLASGADFGCNRYCKASPVDLEGSRGQVLEVLGGCWLVLGFAFFGGRGQTQFTIVVKAAPRLVATLCMPAGRKIDETNEGSPAPGAGCGPPTSAFWILD